MSRIIRKVENEDFYIIYCNTVDMLMPNMFDSIETCQLWLRTAYKNQKLFDILGNHQGILTKDDIYEAIQRLN